MDSFEISIYKTIFQNFYCYELCVKHAQCACILLSGVDVFPKSVSCYFHFSLTLIFIDRFKPGLAHRKYLPFISLNIDHSEKFFN